MRRIACVALMVIVLSSAGHPDAAGADVIWAGGSHKMSNNSNPCSFVDAFILLHRLDDMALFTQPALTLKGGEIGFDLGFGGRSPLMNGEIVGGGTCLSITPRTTPTRGSEQALRSFTRTSPAT